MAKLTLSVDDAVVAKAKRLAAAKKTSMSALFSNYIQSMCARPHRRMPIMPITRTLTGSMKLPRGKSFEQVRDEALLEKHGK